MQTTEVNITEQKVEVYANDIELYLHEYCIEKDIDRKDLYKIDQQRWNSVLLYIYNHVFKPTPSNNPNRLYNGKSNIDYSNKELIDDVCNIYINLCYEYSKEVSIMGFSKLTGIDTETIYNWSKDASGERGSFGVAKKLQVEREESLSNKLSSHKGNPIGILGILNHHYGWNMGQPRTQQERIQTRTPEQIAQDYNIEQLPDNELREPPTPDF